MKVTYINDHRRQMLQFLWHDVAVNTVQCQPRRQLRLRQTVQLGNKRITTLIKSSNQLPTNVLHCALSAVHQYQGTGVGKPV